MLMMYKSKNLKPNSSDYELLQDCQDDLQNHLTPHPPRFFNNSLAKTTQKVS